ncbi:MAG: HEAT repeat domain-containing protein [Terriglobia bacterium]
MRRSWVCALLLAMVGACFQLPIAHAQAPAAPAAPSDPVIEQLKSADAGKRAQAARELGKRGDPSIVPVLTAALSDSSEKVRREVVVALASLRSPQALDPMISATRDREPKVRSLAVQALTGYYTGEVPSTGFTGFVQRTWRRAKGRFVEENIRIDPGVTVEPKVVSALVDTMNDTRAIEVSRKAASGLGILMAQAAVPDLVKAANSADTDLAVEALIALAKIKDQSAGPQLMNLLDSDKKDVKQEAAVTVGVLHTTEALPKLQAIFENNPDLPTRERALEGLAYLGSPVSSPVFLKALFSAEKSFRTFAAEGLARSHDTKALPDLERAAPAEKDAEARLAMQYAITALGKLDYLSAVVAELGSKLHGNSAQAYLVELTRDSSFLPRLYPFMNSQDSDVRRRLCTVLMFTGDATSVEHLEHLSHDRNGDVATEAARALRAVRLRKS